MEYPIAKYKRRIKIMNIIKIKDFAKYPGPRYANLGEFSGEVFRDAVLIPAIMKNDDFSIDFNGVYGFGSSFLEEAFGGLVRKGVPSEKIEILMKNLICDDETIVAEVISYINDALSGAKG